MELLILADAHLPPRLVVGPSLLDVRIYLRLMIEVISDCAINFGQLQRRERLLNGLRRTSVKELHDDGFEQDAAFRYIIIALAKFNILFDRRLHNSTHSIIDIKMGESGRQPGAEPEATVARVRSVRREQNLRRVVFRWGVYDEPHLRKPCIHSLPESPMELLIPAARIASVPPGQASTLSHSGQNRANSAL